MLALPTRIYRLSVITIGRLQTSHKPNEPISQPPRGCEGTAPTVLTQESASQGPLTSGRWGGGEGTARSVRMFFEWRVCLVSRFEDGSTGVHMQPNITVSAFFT